MVDISESTPSYDGEAVRASTGVVNKADHLRGQLEAVQESIARIEKDNRRRYRWMLVWLILTFSTGVAGGALLAVHVEMRLAVTEQQQEARFEALQKALLHITRYISGQ